MRRYDIAIVGSGFAGSLLAMIARRFGRSVVLLERGRHPRFAIGESSTPLSNLLLEELCLKYGLSNITPLTKWGSWQRIYPELACGLKRGFTFFHQAPGQREIATLDRRNQLLVAASPHNEVADTHWYRADFDCFLVREAQEAGVDYLDECEISEFKHNDHESLLGGIRKGQPIEMAARFIVDASGPRGFLHKALRLGERPLPDLPATQALYAHFSGVRKLDDLFGREPWQEAPYPIEDAAVHHVFEGGWAWVLHFRNGITSAGAAVIAPLAARLQLSDGVQAWERLLQRLPVLREQLAHAKAVQPFRHIAQLRFRSEQVTGSNWALLPSSAGFVDPLLSTGFPLTLLGVTRLAKIIEHDWQRQTFAEKLENYALETDSELFATSRLIGALYANMGNFRVFSALSLVYFAIASYSEVARRLGKRHLAQSFLLHDHPQFGPKSIRLLERALRIQTQQESEELIEEVYRLIEPFDVAGLGQRTRFNWYPVKAEELLRSGYKLGASQEEVMQMLERCGFQPVTSQS